MPPKPQPKASAESTTRRSHRAGKADKRPTAPKFFEGVEVLQYVEGEPSPNFDGWYTSLRNVMDRKFPMLEDFLVKLEYPKIKLIKLPTAEEEAADALTGGYGRAERKQKIFNRLSKTRDIDEQKAPATAFIRQTISEESTEALESFDEEIEDCRDPIIFFKTIRTVHHTSGVQDEALLHCEIQSKYDEMKQNKGESLLLYKKRVNVLLTLFDAVGLDRPSEASQVTHFMNSSDKVRYGAAIQALKEKVREGDRVFPTTVHALYLFLVGRVPDSTLATYNPPIDSAFATVEEPPKSSKPGKSPANTKVGKGGKGAKAAQKSDSEVRKLPTRPCCLCPHSVPDKQKMHWQSDCPYLEAFHKSMESEQPIKSRTAKPVKAATYAVLPEHDIDGMYVTVSETIAAAAANGTIARYHVLMDNGATVTVIHIAELLTDIKPIHPPRVVRGIGGTMTIRLQGYFECLDRYVLYCPEFGVSVISHSESVESDNLEVDYQKERRTFIVRNLKTGKAMHFVPKQGLYLWDASRFIATRQSVHAVLPPCESDDESVPDLYASDSDSDNDAGSDSDSRSSNDHKHDREVFVATVEDNKRLFSKREVTAADKACDLVRTMAYPSMRDMYAMIRAGIPGSSVTVQDLGRALQIYGPFVPAIQGKTVRRKPPVMKLEFVPKPVHTDQVLHADLLFIDKSAFLVSVSQPLGLTIASHLREGKGAPALFKCLSHQISQYLAQGFRIKTVVFDGEGAVGNIENEISAMGAATERVAPGAHVVIVERKGRVIRERYRAIKKACGLFFHS